MNNYLNDRYGLHKNATFTHISLNLIYTNTYVKI